jgi:hypothetical protein
VGRVVRPYLRGVSSGAAFSCQGRCLEDEPLGGTEHSQVLPLVGRLLGLTGVCRA